MWPLFFCARNLFGTQSRCDIALARRAIRPRIRRGNFDRCGLIFSAAGGMTGGPVGARPAGECSRIMYLAISMSSSKERPFRAETRPAGSCSFSVEAAIRSGL
jgi:hypothetical protein